MQEDKGINSHLNAVLEQFNENIIYGATKESRILSNFKGLTERKRGMKCGIFCK
jgi:hypothetical protein